MIDANTLMKAAKERTGLSDWGDDWYLEPMHRLVDAINTESELTEFGAGAVPEMLIAHLVNQLEAHDWFKRHPEIKGFAGSKAIFKWRYQYFAPWS